MLSGHAVISLIPTRDTQRARAFYEGVLGLRFIADDGFAAVFETHGRFLRLTKVADFQPQPFSIIAWQVDDIANKVRGLAERGVAFERYDHFEQDELGVWHVPDGATHVAWFKDVDGNLLSLVQSPSETP